MIFSMFAVTVCAHTDAATDKPSETVTEKATEKSTEKSTEKTTQTATEKATEKATEDEHAGHDHGSTEMTKSEIIINIVILGIIVAVAAVLIIKFRAKLGAFLRSVKSELKKVVWASGKDTRKNFLVVIVITVAIAAIIGILDFAFSEGIAGIVKLLK